MFGARTSLSSRSQRRLTARPRSAGIAQLIAMMRELQAKAPADYQVARRALEADVKAWAKHCPMPKGWE